MDFEIRKELKPVSEMTEAEIEVEDVPVSSGFWYSIEEGEGDMFVELLADDETKKKCYEAIRVLSKLESAVDDYVAWM